MEYIEKVILATGGATAPEEILTEEKIITPEEETETEAALEKDEDDPCWSGYVQVGMKEKNGKRVPNCVPSSATIDYLIDDVNSSFGVSRHVSKESAYSVARAALEKYSYLASCDDIHSAIMWELHTFAEYATTGTVADGEDFSMYAEFTAEGHPDTECAVSAAAAWVAGAPDLDNSGREALLTAFSEDSDYVKSLHASTRIRAMVSSGSLTEGTLQQIKNLSDRYSKVN